MIVRSKAPLRLGLAGGGTDVSPYCDRFGGYVLNATVDLYAYCTIEPAESGEIVFSAADLKQTFRCRDAAQIPLAGELLLHKGVYNYVVRQYNRGRPLSFSMTTYSDAPAGSGLGSSSTMVVAILKAFMEWLNLPLGEYDMARIAYEIERKDIGLAGGRQDQYAATFGGFNFIEFFENERVIVNPLRIKNWIKNELESSLILYYTGISRASARIIEEQVKNTREDNKTSVEAMHALKEGALVMKEAILKGNFDDFAACLRESWTAKKRLASGVTNDRIDELYGYILQNGAKAAKISGAGGGGYMIIVCDPKRKYELVEALKKTEGTVLSAGFTDRGTQAWTLYGQELHSGRRHR